MRILSFGVLTLIVQLSQCQRRHSHMKLERGKSCGKNYQSNADSSLLLPAPGNNCHHLVSSTPSVATTFNGGHAELPRSEYRKSTTQSASLSLPSPTSGVAGTSNNASVIEVPATAIGATPPTNNLGSPARDKKGLAYNSASLTTLFAGKGIAWAYNWAGTPDGFTLAGAEYVAMLWGEKFLDTWPASVEAAIASGTTHVLSFNEPDHSSQANMDPATAAQKHNDAMAFVADRVLIGSPAVTNGPAGLPWLNDFFDACHKTDSQPCNVDFVAFHWYDSASNFAYFESYVKEVVQFADKWGIDKIWLTEFGTTSGSDDEVASFIRQAVDYLDSHSRVERYAYFMCSDGLLVKGNAISTPVGEEYVRQ